MRFRSVKFNEVTSALLCHDKCNVKVRDTSYMREIVLLAIWTNINLWWYLTGLYFNNFSNSLFLKIGCNKSLTHFDDMLIK